MGTQNWDHVTDPSTLLILRNETADPGHIDAALTLMHDTMNADVDNDAVSEAVWDAREAALTDAVHYWEENDDPLATIHLIHRFWSV
jgi:hypothetical protein